jgi:hypothetical protein
MWYGKGKQEEDYQMSVDSVALSNAKQAITARIENRNP